MITRIVALTACAVFCSFTSADVLYVDADLAGGANDGSSWVNAFHGVDALATAIGAASSGDEIWVAAGLYKPTTGTSRTLSHNLTTGVAIYGGFTGGETALEQRDFVANETVLSGDLLGNDNGSLGLTDNSYHVVRGNSAGATAILDGFTITAGNANGPTAQDNDKGGGLLMITTSNGTVRNCRLINNRCTFGGGAGYIRQSSPTFEDCLFEDNLGGAFGGAFDMATNCNPTFDRCIVRGNSAARAGGIEIFGNSQPKVRNCLVVGNTATGSGGGGAFFIGASSIPVIRNCTITANTANMLVAGVLTNGSTTSLGNCIIYGNTGPGGSQSAANQVTHQAGGSTTVQYSDVQGGFTGTGNINALPLWTDAPGGDYSLQSGSPGVDAANNALVPAGVTLDLASAPRFADDPATADTGAGTPPIVDMGAYEFQAAAACPADLTGDGTVDGADLGVLLGTFGGPGAADFDGNGVVDGADLGVLLGAWGDC